MNLPVLRLKPRAGRRLAGGHLWVFSNELLDPPGGLDPGADVVVEDSRGRLVGSGTFNPHSLIAVRLHAPRRRRPLDRELVEERVRRAVAFRLEWLGAERSRACRLVFGEGDGLPGVVADRLGDVLSVQLLTAAAERRRGWVLEALGEVTGVDAMVLRGDVPARSREGLPLQVEVLGDVPAGVTFDLDGVTVAADPTGGQKTGFFFDQRENYRLIRPFCSGARVLDAFCYSGAWGLHAARWGASAVTWLDSSEAALELVRAGAAAAGIEDPHLVREDALAYLKDPENRGRFDVVILDPPAFAKTRRTVPEALRGYLNLNKWGLRCVRPGGYLLTCSCSHHVHRERFVETVARAAAAAGRRVRSLAFGGQAPDHPWLPAMPETAYLKCLLLQVGAPERSRLD